MAGAPQIPTGLLSDVRLAIGTYWHEAIGEALIAAGEPVMREVKLNPWLPTGWGGTADFLQWNPEYEAFALWDLKTIKGDAVRWLDRDGAKEGHRWQVSQYWYAAEQMGIPLLTTFGVYYFPITDSREAYDLSPRLIELEPIPEIELMMRSNYVKSRVDEYLHEISMSHVINGEFDWINGRLEPPQQREQKVSWNKQAGVFDLKLVPHWTAAFCPFPDELCDCNTGGTTKIGDFALDHQGGVIYRPRKGYEDITPLAELAEADIRKRQKEEGGKLPG